MRAGPSAGAAGAAAANRADADPAGFVPFPKRVVSQGGLYVRGVPVSAEELVAAVLTESGRRVLAAVADAAAGPATLEEIVEAFFHAQPADPAHFVVVVELTLQAIRDPDGAAAYRSVTDEFRAQMTEVVAGGLAHVGREAVVPVDHLVEALAGIVERSVQGALVAGSPDPHGMARSVMPGVLAGLTRPASPDPG